MPYPGLLHAEPCPCSSPLLTHTSSGDTHTQCWLSLCLYGVSENIQCKDGHNKGQKWCGLNRAEDIKKGWQKYTEELYKKDLHDLDNHDGVMTHLEPDILECEVKWALGSITMSKANGGDGIPVELFQILKDDAMKVLHSKCQQIWKTQQWPQDWKRSVFIQSQRRAMPKNVQTTAQLHSSHMLAK